MSHRHAGHDFMLRTGRRSHAKWHDEHGEDQQEPGEHHSHGRRIAAHIHSIQSAIAIIIRFSVSETNPSGTLLDPPTQAHLSSRLST